MPYFPHFDSCIFIFHKDLPTLLQQFSFRTEAIIIGKPCRPPQASMPPLAQITCAKLLPSCRGHSELPTHFLVGEGGSQWLSQGLQVSVNVQLLFIQPFCSTSNKIVFLFLHGLLSVVHARPGRGPRPQHSSLSSLSY